MHERILAMSAPSLPDFERTLRLAQGNLDEAERLVKRALALTPDDGYITDSLENAGTGQNYGVEVSVEKTLSNFREEIERLEQEPTPEERRDQMPLLPSGEQDD